MKNVKLMLLAFTAMLFLGMGNTSAQIKSVMINGYVSGNREFSISVVNPNYEKQQNEYKGNNKDFHIILKEELDKWLLQGYDIADSSIASTSDSVYRVIYTLIKKE